MTDRDLTVTLVAPASDAGGVGHYTDHLAGALNDAVAQRVTLDRLDGPGSYLQAAISAGQTRADVIHVQHVYGLFGSRSCYMWLFFPVLWVLATIRRRPIILTVHEVWTDETPNPPLIGFKRVYIRIVNATLSVIADRLVFLSSYGERSFEPQFGNVRVIEHGVREDTVDMDPESAKAEFGIDPDETVVAELGYVNARKGFDVFMEIARSVPEETFLLAGGPRRESFMGYYQGLLEDAPGNLCATGSLDEERFHAAFNAADIVLLPYSAIYQSGIFNWCAAYGLPVLASDIEYFQNLADEHGCVAVFDAGDPDVGADRLRDLLADEQRRSELSRNIREYAEVNRFPCVADRHRDLYEGVSGS